jgi:hypothetical protein
MHVQVQMILQQDQAWNGREAEYHPLIKLYSADCLGESVRLVYSFGCGLWLMFCKRRIQMTKENLVVM